MKVQTSRKGGFTLVEIMIVVAIIGLLAAIAIPNFVKARATARAPWWRHLPWRRLLQRRCDRFWYADLQLVRQRPYAVIGWLALI
ncbi:MAG: prepilin-type N-terminal cleavage/methylation domain-containing protein [Proteobacteria bacterium]|nr:prepilin-type N-terminal cleavage/methylation domain-containing protein [Pseudomonadota bacterium]